MRRSFAAALIAMALTGLALQTSARAATPTAASPTAVPVAANALAVDAQAPAKPVSARTQPPAPSPPSSTASLAAAQQRLVQLQNQAQTTSDDGRLAAMGAEAAAIQSQAQATVAARAVDLRTVDLAIVQVTPRAGRRATAAQSAKQAPLLAQQLSLKAQLQQANAALSAATSTYDLIAERRREGFSARVLERSASPLSPDFWTSLAGGASADAVRLRALMGGAAATALRAPEPRGLLGLALGLAAAFVLAAPLRKRLESLGRRKAGDIHPGFARTGAALWVAAVDTILPALAAASLHLGVEWGGLLSPVADALARAGVVAVAWAAAILALSRVLATDLDARHRLLPLPDDAARRMRTPIAAVALVTAAGFLLTRLNYVVGASVAATIAANCLLSLAYSAVAGLILVSFGRTRAPGVAADAATANAGSQAWTLLSLLLTTAILLTLGAVFSGYTTLAALTSSQIFWLSIIAAVTYLLVRFVDDLCAALFGERGWASRTLAVLFNLRRPTIRQAGVLVSAALQLVILIAALSLALTPFGQSGQLLFTELGRFGGAIRFGSATISPSSIAAGVAALFVGMTLVHMVQRWMVRRYLPVTDWDLGVRNSVSTGVGYLGATLALLAALAAMGLSFSQITLIASALSVGIGFGLQQIVQNFVCGVILLVERPVKVGDWISIKGVEGDVRRIRVRATEIQTSDRSTVIVPNADLITNPVQNKTLGDPRGRVQLQLSIAPGPDALKARDLILQAAKADARILQIPAPEVYIDSLGGGAVNFSCDLYVASPRDAYKIRSDLYFEILKHCEAGRLALAGAA